MRFFIALFAFVFSVQSSANSLLFEYEAPTTRTDGTTLAASEIAGYQLTGNGLTIDISADVSEYIAEGYEIAPGANCFDLVTIDTNGRRSDPAATCLPAAPNLPSSFTVIFK
jgi:hypothetical protein